MDDLSSVEDDLESCHKALVKCMKDAHNNVTKKQKCIFDAIRCHLVAAEKLGGLTKDLCAPMPRRNRTRPGTVLKAERGSAIRGGRRWRAAVASGSPWSGL